MPENVLKEHQKNFKICIDIFDPKNNHTNQFLFFSKIMPFDNSAKGETYNPNSNNEYRADPELREPEILPINKTIQIIMEDTEYLIAAGLRTEFQALHGKPYYALNRQFDFGQNRQHTALRNRNNGIVGPFHPPRFPDAGVSPPLK